MNIVFMGTPDFAVPSLKSLIENHKIIGVFTQPDKPKGRGKKLSMSPIKEVALEHNISVYQPVKLKTDVESIKALKDLNPDFIIVVAYGQILTKEILDIPKYGCINLHASLLPKYRGAAPINWSIIKGEKITGNTTMLMDVGLDTGDMLLKQEVQITENMTAEELHNILMEMGGKLLLDTMDKIVKGEAKPQKQGQCEFYASMLNKDTGKINWHEDARSIYNLIRGLNPWPVAYTYFNETMMKIYEATVIENVSSKKPGTILKVYKDGIEVACGKNTLLLKIIQFPGKKAMKVGEYIKGNVIEEGKVLS